MLEPKGIPSSTKFGIPAIATAIKHVPIPIAGAQWPTLVADFPMTEQAWESMLALLKAMKPGLVMAEVKTDEKKPE